MEFSIAGSPANRLMEVQRCRPAEDAPAHRWAAWFEVQADLYEQVAASDPGLNLQSVADHYRRKAKDLLEEYQPCQPWPGAATW